MERLTYQLVVLEKIKSPVSYLDIYKRVVKPVELIWLGDRFERSEELTRSFKIFPSDPVIIRCESCVVQCKNGPLFKYARAVAKERRCRCCFEFAKRIIKEYVDNLDLH